MDSKDSIKETTLGIIIWEVILSITLFLLSNISPTMFFIVLFSSVIILIPLTFFTGTLVFNKLGYKKLLTIMIFIYNVIMLLTTFILSIGFINSFNKPFH